MDRSNKKLRGFTLLELITVVAIIAVMAAILVPSVSNYILSNKIRTANTQAQQIYMAAQDYLMYEQINGTKASEISESGNICWIAVRTEIGSDSGNFDKTNKTEVVDYYNIQDGSSDPSRNFIKKKITVSGIDEFSYPIADAIENRLESGFKGSWLVAFYPKTFTVAYAVYNDNYSTAAECDAAVQLIGTNSGVKNDANCDDRLYKSEYTMNNTGSTWETQESDFQHPTTGIAPHLFTGQFPIPGPNLV